MDNNVMYEGLVSHQRLRMAHSALVLLCYSHEAAWAWLLSCLHLSWQIKETVPTAAPDMPHNMVHVGVDQRAGPRLTQDRHMSGLVWVAGVPAKHYFH